ncbi:MAG: LytR C-terminal domain-containing protein [Gaiellaceae bacterium]
MESTATPLELVAPWRKATLFAAGVAIVELTLVIALTVVLVSGNDGVAAAALPETKPAGKHAPTTLARPKTRVLVLNGNGRVGAAGAMAQKLRGFTYRVAAVGNAERSDYGRSVVLYRPGREAEARRLAKDLVIKLVGPLDGMSAAKLHGAHVALILGR